MSRIGKAPISLPSGTKVTVVNKKVTVEGPKGRLELEVQDCVEVAVEENQLNVLLKEGYEEMGNFHGLYRSLISNMVLGTSQGFQKSLEMHGVGFRAAVKGDAIDLQVGFSHPTLVEIPKGLSVSVEKNTLITISGIDKQQVGQFAAVIRAKRPPEPYKGKGIRYKDEYVRRKAGKSAK